MEKNKVGLDSQIAQIADALLEVPEEFRIETAVVPVFQRASNAGHDRTRLRRALERIEFRLVFVVRIAFGEDAHSHLIKRCIFERGQRLFFHRVSLMCPGIAGGADLKIRSTVGVCKVPGLVHTNRAVIARRWFYAGEFTRFGVKLSAVTFCYIGPLAQRVRHKADAIHAVTVIESFRLNNSAALLKLSAQFYINKWISAFRPL
ncbi:hypothetical protein ES703_124009 [subsurface metagenome]